MLFLVYEVVNVPCNVLLSDLQKSHLQPEVNGTWNMCPKDIYAAKVHLLPGKVWHTNPIPFHFESFYRINKIDNRTCKEQEQHNNG